MTSPNLRSLDDPPRWSTRPDALGASPPCRRWRETAKPIPPPALDEPDGTGYVGDGVIAGGCFWGVQGVFQHVTGVIGVISGYAGGDEKTASYGLVGRGRTGHAEAVSVAYDPHKVP